MKVSLQWLRDLIPGFDMGNEELFELLADRGAPVEEVVEIGGELGGVLIGRVNSVRPHPNADRLRVCEVDNGEEVLQVVCGAPVIHEGGFYPFAPAGTTLPGGLKLKKAKIRGEVSNGMLCSEKELGLGRDQGGIMHLQSDGLEAGQSFIEAIGLDDLRVEIEVSPNRGDWLSHVGVAREIAPAGVADVQLPPVPGAPELDLDWLEGDSEGTVGGVRVRLEEPDMCPRFVGAVIRGVKVGPSPEWLQRRLRAVGQQPINNVVDATNYLMLETGNPMHAYDLAHMAENEVVVRYARDGEKMETLDGVERSLTSDMMMVCDAKDPHDIAGIMGGEHSSVTESTTDVFLEAALWIPASTRATRRALNISTDASYRFERGVDPLSHPASFTRALEVILATAGGEVDGGVLDLRPTTFEHQVIELRLARVEGVLGVAFSAAEIAELLGPIGFECEDAGASVQCTVPSWRSYDVTREIDLIEEVARMKGFGFFEGDLGPARPSSVPDHPLFQLEDDLRALLAGWGLYEAQNPAFSPAEEGTVELKNPISLTESSLRASLIPALVRNVEYNWARGAHDVRLFELGTVFANAGKGERPDEATHLGVVLTGADRPSHWDRKAEAIDFWTLKGFAEALFERIPFPGLSVDLEADASGLFDPSLSFLVRDADGTVRGRGGRVNPERVDAPAWAGELLGLEVALPDDPAAPEPVTFEPLPAFPGTERDLALLVPVAVESASVLEHATVAGGKLLESVDVFDLYEGDGVPEGHRSLAIRLRLQAPDRTLRDKDADKVVGKVLRRLQEELGVEQRG